MSDIRNQDHRVRCHDCGRLVRAGGAALIKASNPAGRAWQCDPCHQDEMVRIHLVNRAPR